MGPQDSPNRPRSPEDINGPKLPGLPREFDNFLDAWRFGVFWGSEGTLEKGSWGSKSIGYQAFYRFRCVLGVQICRIPGFLSIQMRFGVQIYRIPGFLSIQMRFGGPNL